MAAGNTITVIGNVTREPELRFTPSGQANVKFGLAVNRRWQEKSSGEWQEATSFFDVVCWAQMAENVAESLPKGSRAIVTGRLEQRSYEDREGNKRSAVEIVADEVGPSLRWASCEITKNERRGGDGPSGGGSRPGGSNSGSTAAAAGNTASAAPSYDGFGEEPF
ncbi:MAG: single-stranded DNA-binding protein [Acidimicrobiia bacterium]